MMWASDGIIKTWGGVFDYRTDHVFDDDEKLAQGRYGENAKRKRKLNSVQFFENDFLALRAFLHTIAEENWPEWGQRMLDRLRTNLTMVNHVKDLRNAKAK